MFKRGYTCRCHRCFGRRTLRMKPSQYVRAPRCHACRTPSMFIDKYRMRYERAAARGCDCHGYGFLHRKGSKFCIHASVPVTHAQHEERHGIRPAPF